jgi:hypothetical protein
MNAHTRAAPRGSSLLGLVLVIVSLAASPLRAQGSASIDLRVTDSETGAPLAGASVRVDGAPAGRSDGQGRLHLRALAAGTHQLEVSMLGRHGASPEVDLAPGRMLDLEVALDPAVVPLPVVRVVSRMRLPGDRAGDGDEWTRALDDAVLAAAMQLHAQALAELSAPRPNPVAPQLVGRELADPKAGDAGGGTGPDVCVPALYVDGVPVEYVGPVYLGDLGTASIEYADGPPEFGAVSSECGVILIWTQR